MKKSEYLINIFDEGNYLYDIIGDLIKKNQTRKIIIHHSGINIAFEYDKAISQINQYLNCKDIFIKRNNEEHFYIQEIENYDEIKFLELVRIFQYSFIYFLKDNIDEALIKKNVHSFQYFGRRKKMLEKISKAILFVDSEHSVIVKYSYEA